MNSQRVDVLTYATIFCFSLFLLLTPLRVENITGDAAHYIGLAKSLVSSGSYEFNFRQHTRFPPGLPVIIALIQSFVCRGYFCYMKVIAVFAVLSLLCSYQLLRTCGEPQLGFLTVLVLASSPAFYERASRHLASDFPYFCFSVASLLLANRIESNIRVEGQILRSVLLALAVFSSVMVRSIGAALVASLSLRVFLGATSRSGLTRSQFWALFPAAFCGLLAQGLLMWWQSLNSVILWRGEFMHSYLAQFLLKDSHNPELGAATYLDFGIRALRNLMSLAAHSVEVLTHIPWVDPHWYSPVVVFPALLVIVGFWRSVRKGIGVIELYFVFYIGISGLWPFDEGARYVFPVFPMILLYAWQGVLGVFDQARHDLSNLAPWVRTAATAFIFLMGIVSCYYAQNVGLQARLSLLFWLALTILLSIPSVRGLVSGRFDHRVAAPLLILTLVAGVALGLYQQGLIARGNLQGSPSLITHLPAIEAARVVKRHLRVGDSLMAGQHAIIHYVTGYRTLEFPATTDAALIKEVIDRYNVRFLLVNLDEKNPYFLPPERERLAALRARFPEIGTVIYQDGKYLVLKIGESR